MAKFAILSDIHGNIQALEVVLAKCEKLGVTKFISLGDIVGYNGNPAECLKIVRNLDLVAAVRGNHDEYAGNDNEDIVGFNPHAKAAVSWTRSQLSDEERSWLMATPYRKSVPMDVPGCNTTIVHATLDSPENWGYIFDMHHAIDNFTYQFTPLCFCGHSHVPLAFCKKPITAINERQVEELNEWVVAPNSEDFSKECEFHVEIRAGHKYLFNIGSIGQPRNHDNRASFAVLDTDRKTVSRYCLPYDIAATQERIRSVGLPERLANRLISGI